MLDHQITLRNSEDPYGEISSAHIVIEGRIIPLRRSKQVVRYGKARNVAYYDYDLHLESPEILGDPKLHDYHRLVKGTSSGQQYLVSLPCEDSSGEECFEEACLVNDSAFLSTHLCALIAIVGEDCEAQGIIVQPDEVEENFRRVGYFHLDLGYDDRRQLSDPPNSILNIDSLYHAISAHLFSLLGTFVRSCQFFIRLSPSK